MRSVLISHCRWRTGPDYAGKRDTANTGMDALSHDVEALVAALASPYTDILAIDSGRKIFDNLPRAYKNGDDIEAGQAMHDASCFAGMAFSNAILGIVHSITHQVGGMFGIPHGRANAILMPNVIRFNSRETTKYELLAEVLGKKSSEDLAQEIARLREVVGIENSYREYGIDPNEWETKLDEMAKNAMGDPCTGTNPRKPTLKEMKSVFMCCFKGGIFTE